MSKDDEVVPSFDGTIMMKVTRLPASAAKVMKKETQKVAPKRTAPKPQVIEESPKSTEPVSESTIKSDPVPSTEDFFSSIVMINVSLNL